MGGTGAVWMDYMSVPQDAAPGAQALRKKSIGAIAQYVSLSACFLCLLPPASCESPAQEKRWESRGWCRMELTANALSPSPRQCIVVRSMTLKYAIPGQSWMYASVGAGDFADLGDRIFLGLVIRRLVEQRQALARQAGDLTMFRFLEAKKPDLLSSTPSRYSYEAYSTFEKWMRTMLWEGEKVDNGLATGFTLLRFSAIGNRWIAAMQLLERRANVAAPLTVDRPEIGAIRGRTILHDACAHCLTPNTVELLLNFNADPWRPDTSGMAALHHACWRGRCSTISAILRATPEIGVTVHRDAVRAPWTLCVLRGHTTAFRHFVQEYPFQINLDPDCETCFGYGLVSAAVVGEYSGADMVSLVLTQGYNVNHRVSLRHFRARLQTQVAQARCFVQDDPSFATEFSANLPGSASLHLAALLGRPAAAGQLLAAAADVHAANGYGRTPLVLAAMRGHGDVAKMLLQAWSDAAAADCWGRTAAFWAGSRGHEALAQLLAEEAGGCGQDANAGWCRAAHGCPRRRGPAAAAVRDAGHRALEVGTDGPHRRERPDEELWSTEASEGVPQDASWDRGGNSPPPDRQAKYSSPPMRQRVPLVRGDSSPDLGGDAESDSGSVASREACENGAFGEIPKLKAMPQMSFASTTSTASTAVRVGGPRPLQDLALAPVLDSSSGVLDVSPPARDERCRTRAREEAAHEPHASDLFWV